MYRSLNDQISSGRSNVFIVKCGPADEKLWTRQLGSSEGDRSSGIIVGTEGDIYVTGTVGAGFHGHLASGNTDIFLVKYDRDAEKLWTRQLGTERFDGGSGIAMDQESRVYIAGVAKGSLNGQLIPLIS